MLNLTTVSSQQAFIQSSCSVIAEQANKNIAEKGGFTFVLSGGRTPKDVFIELASNYRDKIDWSKVHFFWLDERCVEPAHDDSNYKLAYEYLISKLHSVGSVNRMKGELPPIKAAQEYKQQLMMFFTPADVIFDFVLLGMGEDGHVASLFPASKELGKVEELVLATDKIYNGYLRITLGLNVINKTLYKLLVIKESIKLNVIESQNGDYPINKITAKNVIYLRGGHVI